MTYSQYIKLVLLEKELILNERYKDILCANTTDKLYIDEETEISVCWTFYSWTACRLFRDDRCFNNVTIY